MIKTHQCNNAILEILKESLDDTQQSEILQLVKENK